MEAGKVSPLGGLTIVALAGLIGFTHPTQPEPPTVRPEVAKQLADLSAGLPNPDDNTVKAVCAHFGMSSARGDQDKCWERARAEKTLPIIATVPNPDEGHLALYFDRWVESIERAVSDSGFNFDRYWMPWKPEPASAESHQILRLAEEAQRQRAAGQPGLLLFRTTSAKCNRNNQSPSLLAVLLVGESSTSGIDLEQFGNAIKYAGKLCSDCPVRILGPSFSGSFHSLAYALRGGDGSRIQVISGTATNDDAAREFIDEVPLVHYRATVHSDTTAIHAFRKLVRETWMFRGRIAIITEDGTRYGSDIATHWKGDKDERIVSFRFPREISRLRNVTDMDDLSKLAPKALLLPSEFRPFDMKTDGPMRDAIPDFAKRQTPTSQEAALNSIAAALRREKIKMAVVVATDILDILFVTRFLRLASPDTRIVLFDADILLARAAESMPLRGVLSVTTYPLFLRSQHRKQQPSADAQPPRRVVFPSRYAQGVYNACRALLLGGDRFNNGASGLTIKTSPREEMLVDYSSPRSKKGDPALWVTVAGRGGFWPVHTLAPDADQLLFRTDAVAESNQQGLTPEPPSRSIYLFTLAATVLCVGFLIATIRGIRCVDEPKAWFAFASFPKEPAEGRPGRAFFLAMLSFALVGILSSASAPLWGWWTRSIGQRMSALSPAESLWDTWSGMSRGAVTSFIVLFSMCVAILLLIAGLFWVRRLVANRLALGGSGRTYLVLMGVVAMLLLSFYWCAWQLTSDPSTYDNVLYRSLHLNSGVSPTLPVVLLWSLIGMGSWVHLRRIIFHDELNPQLPDLKQHVLCPPLAPLTKRLDETAQRPLFDAAETSGAAILILIAVICSSSWHKLQTFEPDEYNWMLTGLASAAFVMIMFASMRAIYIWRNLRSVLEQIERHPVRHAFSRLPRPDAWSPLGHPGVTKRTHNAIVCSLETLRALRGERESLYLAQLMNTEFDRAQANVKRILASDANRSRESCTSRHQLYAFYRRVAENICEHLETEWAKGHSLSLEDAQAKKEHAHDTCEELKASRAVVLQEEFVALRVVSWIRYVLRQIRNLFQFIVVGFVLFVLALNSYPFQSEKLIAHLTIGMSIVLGLVVITILAGLDRDSLLSRITNSTAGKLEKTFYLRLMSYGAVPALTVFASQFPSVGRVLYSAVQPALEALR